MGSERQSSKAMESRVIIVGSSDSVFAQKRGHEIDEFWQVVRCNRAPTVGYQEYVGSRTTERFVNPNFLRNEWGADTSPLQTHEINDCVITHWDNITPKDFYRHWNSSTTCRTIVGEWKIKLSHIDIEVDNSHNATCGFQAIMEYLWMNPVIYGFDLEADHIFHHYWRKQKRNSTYHHHSYEKEVIRELIEREYISVL